MMNHVCPTCGHKQPKPRATKAATMPERADIDREFQAKRMTQPAYYEACKRIARRDDLRFLIRVAGDAMPAALLFEASALLAQLETRKATAADVAAINSLRDRYRVSKGSLVVYAGARANVVPFRTVAA
jgi:hypothetical protein